MTLSRDQWFARCTIAACVASRWVSGASLGVAVVALCFLSFLQIQSMAEIAIAIAAAAGGAQAYLAARVEFERVIFEDIASAADAGTAANDFDAAAREVGLQSSDRTGRDMAQRTSRLLMLTNAIFFVFLFQLSLLLAAGWISH